MKMMFKTIMYIVFLVIVTQALPKIINPDNDYNMIQIIFLLIISFGISMRNRKPK